MPVEEVVLQSYHSSLHTIDGSDGHATAIKRYNEAHGTNSIIRQVQCFNTMAEQDHRAVTRVTRPMVAFKRGHCPCMAP